MKKRDELQQRVVNVGLDVFGERSMYSLKERALRFFEEANELARICGLSREEMQRVFDFEQSRPIGYSTLQELGGAGVTLMALSHICQFDLRDVIDLEITRVEDNKNAIQEKARNKPANVHAEEGMF